MTIQQLLTTESIHILLVKCNYQFAFANAVNGDANEFYDVPSPIISSFEAARNE